MTSLIGRLIHAIRRQADAPVDDTPKLNRAQRRGLANMKPSELRMRRDRTFIAQSKRRKGSRGDHGAKSKRAYQAGVENAVRYLNVRIQQAYVLGLKEGRAQRGLVRRVAAKARAIASTRPTFGKQATP